MCYIICMKNGIKSFLVYSLILYFVLNLFNEGIKLPQNATYLLLTIFVLSLTVMMACPLLSFLTVKCKFPTFFLMTSLLLVGMLYLMKIFMIDFYIETFRFEGMDLGSMQINSFDVIPILSISMSAIACAFVCSFYRELDSN